jgi:putative ABC transport system substrate-binding protein
MRLFGLVVVLALGLALGPPAVEAQPAGRVWRIGWLSAPSAAVGAFELNALREGLRGLNYVEGRNITIEAIWGDGDLARLPALGSALAVRKVDIIFTAGTPATLAAKQATTTIPIVFARVLFPERTGLVSSLARPGGNLTGVTYIGPEYAKRLDLLREVVPKLSRVALLYNDKNSASVMAMNETQEAATAMRIAFEPLGIHDRPTLDAAFTAMRRRLPDALMTTADSVISSHRTSIVDFATQYRLTSMYGDRIYLEAGGLMFFGTSTTDMWRHAAVYADRIFKGAKPADLPVEQPTKFELVINLKTAKALGLTIPQSILLRADHVIE